MSEYLSAEKTVVEEPEEIEETTEAEDENSSETDTAPAEDAIVGEVEQVAQTEPVQEVEIATQQETPQVQTAPTAQSIVAQYDTSSIHHYSVAGITMPIEYQNYIYDLCKTFGIESYYPYFMLQFFQESHYNQAAVSASGDYGICQLKGIYHNEMKAMVGHPEWDLVNDPYANMYVGVYLMAQRIKYNGGNIEMALSDYYNGLGYSAVHGIYHPYSDAVLAWQNYMVQID